MFSLLRKLFGRQQPSSGDQERRTAADRHSPPPAVVSTEPHQVVFDEELTDKLRLVTYIDILRERGYTLTEGKVSLLAQPTERALDRLMAAGMPAQQARRMVDDWVGQRRFRPGGQGTPDKVLPTLVGAKIGVGMGDWIAPEIPGADVAIEIPEWKGKEAAASVPEAAAAVSVNIEPDRTDAVMQATLESVLRPAKPKSPRTATKKIASAKQPAKSNSKTSRAASPPRKTTARARKAHGQRDGRPETERNCSAAQAFIKPSEATMGSSFGVRPRGSVEACGYGTRTCQIQIK